MADSAAWTLSDIAPNDNTFRAASEETHREFWRYIASIGVDRFHWRCNQGIGANGEPLTPIAASTARRGRKRSYTGLGNAGNPPLVPALGLSRTEALLEGRGFADHAEWFWRTDPVTGLHWGQVMLWHAAGGGGRYPARNVIGWSAADVAWLRMQGQTWWYAHQHGHKIAEAMSTLETARDKFPRMPAAVVTPGMFKVSKGERTDVQNAVFSNGAAETSRRAIEAGTSTGFRVTSGGMGSRGGGKAKPAKPAPTAPMAPRAAPKPVARRPAAVAQPAAKPVTIAAPGPKRKPGETIPAQPAATKWANPLAHERTKPAPAPAARVGPSGPAPDLATFAARAKAAAATVQSSHNFGTSKVLISHAHEAYVKAHGPIRIEDYKAQLGLALQARHIDLSRADIVQALDEFEAARSVTYHPMSSTWEFYFIRLGP